MISPAAPPQAPSEPVTALTDVLFSEPVEDPVDLEDEELNLSFTLPDVERQVSEDANAAVSGSTFGDDAPTEIDPDEELWDRWARSGENDVVRASEDDPLGLGKRADNWPN